MSGGGNNSSAPKLDLKLNLSPPVVNNNNQRSAVVESPNASVSSSSSSTSEISAKGSCLSSSELGDKYGNCSSPESSSMVLAGCPRCLMYVMLSDVDPKCPKCKSTVLLDVLSDDTTSSKKPTN